MTLFLTSYIGAQNSASDDVVSYNDLDFDNFDETEFEVQGKL